jgi:spore germination protein Q
MNNNYVNNSFPGTPLYSGGTIVPNQNTGGEITNEQSYIENILRLNRGKTVEIYMSFSDSNEWRDKVFYGVIEQSGRDHIILSDPRTGSWYLLLMIYIDYIKFDERIISSGEFYPNN